MYTPDWVDRSGREKVQSLVSKLPLWPFMFGIDSSTSANETHNSLRTWEIIPAFSAVLEMPLDNFFAVKSQKLLTEFKPSYQILFTFFLLYINSCSFCQKWFVSSTIYPDIRVLHFIVYHGECTEIIYSKSQSVNWDSLNRAVMIDLIDRLAENGRSEQWSPRNIIFY